MKRIIFFLVLLVILSCKKNQPKENKIYQTPNKEELTKYDIVEEKQDKDTIKNFWPIDLDTIKSSENIKNNEEILDLRIINYSLNDSSIVKNVDSDLYHINSDVYHNRISVISLSKGGKTILEKKINKSDFRIKDSEFNQYSIIKYIEFVNEKNGDYFFKATLNIPDTDWVEKIKFSIQKDNPEKIKLL
ncbi:DUF4738 domain-containing protein [Flavobacterium sp. F52]|uniref:DUF4738 domain-containing protein n=1 Tax=Flavobacterium sp. F52 TaxID=1202532 RepID=UPI000272D839|nr:DUF4738 domain-containing protein [Flavobacterium sp. F52]EJG03528.1 hypothetical protein FF52_00235 [Flavobacterium sp. F52]